MVLVFFLGLLPDIVYRKTAAAFFGTCLKRMFKQVPKECLPGNV